MSEKEIRQTVRQICADLDERARWVVKNGVKKLVLPTVLGAGLALAGCSDDTQPPPSTDTMVQADLSPDLGPQVEYMAPDIDSGSDAKVLSDGASGDLKIDLGPYIEYGAVFVDAGTSPKDLSSIPTPKSDTISARPLPDGGPTPGPTPVYGVP